MSKYSTILIFPILLQIPSIRSVDWESKDEKAEKVFKRQRQYDRMAEDKISVTSKSKFAFVSKKLVMFTNSSGLTYIPLMVSPNISKAC